MPEVVNVWRSEDLAGFQNLLAKTILSAPDSFDVLDFLRPEQQLTFALAFEELANGLDLVAAEVRGEAKMAELRALLEAARMAYVAGDHRRGVLLLQLLDMLVVARLMGGIRGGVLAWWARRILFRGLR